MSRMTSTAMCMLACMLIGCTKEETASVDRIPVDQTNAYYASNAASLVPQQFIKLPAGSITPGGWILKEMELQKDGLNGHLGEISRWLDKNDNQWLNNVGSKGWEEVPYWLRGYSSLAWILGDQEMKDEAMIWIDAILASQQENGDFGPIVLRNGIQDLWPNMLALTLLQDYYEFSGDERVIPFMTNYFKYELSLPDDQFLQDYWENSRAGDNLFSVIWLYNRTKESWLLDLAKKIHANTANWEMDSSLPNWHNVNIAECFREPATYYVVSKDSSDLLATYNDQSLVRRAFGQVPGGMFGGDENCRPGYIDPRQGTETCAFAEQMWSDEILLMMTGDPMWAENLEDVAFNSYPAAFMPDMKSLRYLTSPNQAISSKENHSPGIQNGGTQMAMTSFSYRCCQHNHGFAWPYYNEHLMFATPDNGAAAVLFNDCIARIKVGENGQDISITETTHYPFDEKIEFRIGGSSDVRFPFYIRIPSWCNDPSVKVNGKKISKVESGKYLRIERTWKVGDVVEMNLPMHISTRTWQANKNSVSVDYGPLTLSLEIGEDYRQYSQDTRIVWDPTWRSTADSTQWLAYEILPTTDWNYALATDSPVKVEKGEWPSDDNPFTVQSTPLRFKAKGRLVPSWGVDKYGLTGVLPFEDAPKADNVDEITLIPMGAARLRISAFPTCSSK